ncbi:MAG: hypothetical protein COT34_01855 [Candidatus Nealsonbacteria bacterium CG08_land_8_20_14_0_20_43_11]|uniref:Uncharacterized protein n=1 Tax=Candidatus Nealsonbacteria bacterium CG08_land_8_20_14_0_20_43_11 TaxID=1974706 RepID=A0A2M6T0F8_9BACT|nr:MAG: hypothetical protein COT34_01855 [Candidatus Nealsonbacteria bacterium CG08_land_8_20_14_0_20_43_11]
MVTEELLEYIKKQLKKDASLEEIKSKLMANGWDVDDIDEGLNLVISGLQAESENQENIPAPELIPQPAQPAFTPLTKEPVSSGASQEADTLEPFIASPRTEPAGLGPAKSKRKVFAIIAVIVGLMIIGGGAGGYFYYSQLPETVFRKVAQKAAIIKSFDYKGEVAGEINFVNDFLGGLEESSAEAKEENLKFSLTALGGVDFHDLKKPQFSSLLSFSGEDNNEKVNLGIEMRLIDKVFYAQITELPELGQETGFDTSGLKNQWLKIDPAALEKEFSAMSSGAVPEEEKEKSELSDEQIKEIQEALNQQWEKWMKKVMRLTDEKIEGAKTYHYKVPIDKVEIKDLVLKIGKIVEGKEVSKEVVEDLDESLKATDFGDLEIWIGKKDFFVYKISQSMTIKNLKDEKIGAKYQWTLLLKNFNQPVTIEVPKSATPLEELLNTWFGPAQALNKNAMVSSYMGTLQTVAELNCIEDGNYDKFTCEGAENYVEKPGYPKEKYADLKVVCNSIAKEAGEYPIINKPAKNSQSYCVYVSLPGKIEGTQYYVCIEGKSVYSEDIREGKTAIDPGLSSCTKKSYRCPKDTK